ncbi:acetyltransferase [Betaproteobacteria bacterium]|nr:acetyltransferase [Betaproteobacteria bacterium]GHU01900.1 acetyltransferase [Betaproteobacteria bacterium]GHU17438.1 acetyltransferase [Betaproteobacteria bacterium]
MATKIQPLSRLPKALLDARAGFDCGSPALNRYLAEIAAQHEARNITRTFCGVRDGELFGFYALTNADVNVSTLPREVIKKYKLPTHRLPVVRLARLAIDLRFQRQGLGQGLMIDAMCKLVRVAESSGCIGLAVDAKDAQAADFYKAFGFRQTPDDGLLLFMPLPDIRALIKG